MANTAEYQIPACVRIGRGTTTDKLYKLETKVMEDIRISADELARVLGHERSQYWTQTLPLELFTVLESFDQRASIAAALGYLKYYRERDPQLVAQLEAKAR